MVDRITSRANNFVTALAADVGATDLTFQVETTSGGPASPCYIVINPDDDAKIEVIYCDGSFDATNFRTSGLTNRFLSGSAASSGLTHSAGDLVAFVTVKQLFDDLDDRVSQHTHDGTTGEGVNVPQASITGHDLATHDSLGLRATMVGEVIMAARSDTPAKWLECNGQAVSRTTYASLFSAIGTDYGTGDGSTTFNVPNFTGRVPVGVGTLGSDVYARGTQVGTARHTLVANEIPSHTHTGPSHTHTGPSHTHTGPSHTHSFSDTSTSSGGHSHTFATKTNTDSSHTHFEDTFNWDVPASQASGGTATGGNGTTNSESAHTHDVSGTTGSSGTGTTGSGGTGNTGSSGTGNTGATGGSLEHENRQPSLGIRFLIYAGV